VSNILRYLVFLILLNNCSLDTKSRIWTNKSILVTEKNNDTQLIVKKEPSNKKFNSQFKVKLTSKLDNKSLVNNISNNNGRVNYDGNLKKISKYKFSKINNFKYHEPELIFESDNLIFFNNNGSIMKFDVDSNIITNFNF